MTISPAILLVLFSSSVTIIVSLEIWIIKMLVDNRVKRHLQESRINMLADKIFNVETAINGLREKMFPIHAIEGHHEKHR